MIDLLIILLLLVTAMVTGSILELRHYKDIKRREKKFLNKPAITARTIDASKRVMQTELVTGSVVVSVDYFKRFMSGFRNIFGGEMKSYSSLIDRGRRESILRMKENCPDADQYINLRMETSTISGGRKEKSVGCVEVIAYSTALIFEP